MGRFFLGESGDPGKWNVCVSGHILFMAPLNRPRRRRMRMGVGSWRSRLKGKILICIRLLSLAGLPGCVAVVACLYLIVFTISRDFPL